MVKYTCEYCGTQFSDRSNMSRHQRRAQYCLQARGLETKEYQCTCGKSFSRKDNLQQHKEKCLKTNMSLQQPLQDNVQSNDNKLVQQFLDMVKDLQRQNGELQKQIADISLRPTTVTNNNNNNVTLNNLKPITDEDLQSDLDNLELEFILDGARGLANFANFYPLKDNIVCTDKSRKKIKYKDENGEITDDSRLLAQRFFQAISERNKDIVNTAYRDVHEQVQEIVAGQRAGETDITGLLTKATNMQDILIRSQNAAAGKDEEFTQEFLNHLVKIT